MKKKSFLNEEHEGFALEFEVIATLFMMTVFIVVILYTTRVMNVQRYMNTVLTSTAATASRWGGTNTNAYRTNVSNTPLLSTAQQQLNYIAGDYNPKISGYPDKISLDSDLITVKITYSLPSIFSTTGKVQSVDGSSYDMYNILKDLSMSVQVNSVMNSGKLL